MIYEPIVYVSLVFALLCYNLYRYITTSNKKILLIVLIEIICMTILVLSYEIQFLNNILIETIIFFGAILIPAVIFILNKYNKYYLKIKYILLGKINEYFKNHDKQIQIYEKIIEIEKNSKYLEMLGTVYLKKNNIDLALEYFIESLELNNISNYNLCYKIACVYLKINDYEEAIKYLNIILDINPNCQNVLNLFAYMDYLKGEYLLSINKYNNLLKLDYKNSILYNNIGSIYFLQGHLKKAIERYLKSINYKKNYYALYCLANIYYINNDFDNAIKYSNICKNSKEFSSSIYYLLAQIYMLKNEDGKAMTFLQLAFKQDKTFVQKALEDNIFEKIKNFINSVNIINKETYHENMFKKNTVMIDFWNSLNKKKYYMIKLCDNDFLLNANIEKKIKNKHK